ncbi:MAG: hypothetical protein AMJ92_03635 [candidate division Zixibacteria bacterium SM23_81]|nr:MAG: hypothetical protein AMJ92_03635 [candidate division Zixibacteria bacterium SM23_81]
MQLMATSIDGFLAYWCGLHEVRGEIHSVFQRALNIRTYGGQLISILSRAGLDGPNTMVTELPQDLNFVTMGLSSGMPVRLDGVEADLGQGALNLNIGTAQKWWPRLAGGAERLNMDRLKRNFSAIRRTMPKEESREGLSGLLSLVGTLAAGRWRTVQRMAFTPLTHQAIPGIRDIMMGALKRKENLLGRGLRELIGLGTGQTPSGDDLLLGFIGTLSVVSRRVGGPEVEDLLRIIRRDLGVMKERTTFISGRLLSYACAGRISSPIISVVRAMLFGDAPDAHSSARALMRLGADSGSEILLGVLLALSLVPRLSKS